MTDSPNPEYNPLALSPEERRQLAQAFSARMDEEDGAASDDRAWKEELLRRVTEMRNGTAETMSADEAFAQAQRMFGEGGAPSAAPAAEAPEDVEAAWAEEIRARMADYMAGRTPASSADEVFAKLRAHRGSGSS
ncbi:addiction module protein [Longimicrobium terrae]|uniref:Putative addiction module component (TIGR02574 family) n=1 Tax=Longimicrobium terrae TaxID=1639882 RepID=A0A841H0I5_9BACT|nr:addiction module protein [Longimicrobium terrae]MBB4637221.1 putative addiction module component (TIGR02574 family) [Longimicrobium terrae]MBB6071517.1 putative addiction module component (TIGR02574 family) [Longimicrobium terrae]NNC30061.1 addiction module protein [Longimicrobium terrae]